MDGIHVTIYTNIKGVFLDGIHGTPYIAAPLGSVMGKGSSGSVVAVTQWEGVLRIESSGRINGYINKGDANDILSGAAQCAA